MRILKIRNKRILLDDLDYEFVKRFTWSIEMHGKTLCYFNNQKLGKLHRFIMGYPRKMVDHINGNTLDNRKINLRSCTHKENIRNQKIKGFFKGVYSRKNAYGWSHFAAVSANNKQYYLGNFKTKKEAAQAYDKMATKLHGKFACINFPLKR